MNPMNASSGVPALWQEARNPEGRVYYYNTQTKATQWTKPVELMTGVEVSLSTAAILYVEVDPDRYSVLWQISHGRNTPQMEDASTGTIPKASRAPGRCPRFIRMRWHRLPQLRKSNARNSLGD
jgi:pre-mRNA-processing factor 40